jgi:hypothetical protein
VFHPSDCVGCLSPCPPRRDAIQLEMIVPTIVVAGRYIHSHKRKRRYTTINKVKIKQNTKHYVRASQSPFRSTETHRRTKMTINDPPEIVAIVELYYDSRHRNCPLWSREQAFRSETPNSVLQSQCAEPFRGHSHLIWERPSGESRVYLVQRCDLAERPISSPLMAHDARSLSVPFDMRARG